MKNLAKIILSTLSVLVIGALVLSSCKKNLLTIHFEAKAGEITYDLPAITSVGDTFIVKTKALDLQAQLDANKLKMENVESIKLGAVDFLLLEGINDTNHLGVFKRVKAELLNKDGSTALVLGELVNNPDDYSTYVVVNSGDKEMKSYLTGDSIRYKITLETRRPTGPMTINSWMNLDITGKP